MGSSELLGSCSAGGARRLLAETGWEGCSRGHSRGALGLRGALQGALEEESVGSRGVILRPEKGEDVQPELMGVDP